MENKVFTNNELAIAGLMGILAYAYNQKITNVMFLNAVKEAECNKFQKDKDWKKIENCLKRPGVDINYKLGRDEMSPLMLAVKYKKEDLITYLLEKKADINTRNWAGFGILETMLFEVLSTPKDKKIFEFLLKKGLNPNDKLISRNYFSALYWTISCRDDDFTKLLIKYGANVNLRYEDHTPLTWALFHKKTEVIQRLCQARASLENVDAQDNTIFHPLTKCPLNYIKTIIAYSRFDAYNQVIDGQLKESILGTLLTFKKIGFCQPDLIFRILSKLSIEYLFAYKGLYKELLNKNYYNILLPQVRKHIKSLEEILKHKNSKGKTVFDRLQKNESEDKEYNWSRLQLFNLEELKEDMEILSQAKKYDDISKNNLALTIYNNYEALLK